MDFYRHARDLYGQYADRYCDGEGIHDCEVCGARIMAEQPVYAEADGALDAGPSVWMRCAPCHHAMQRARRDGLLEAARIAQGYALNAAAEAITRRAQTITIPAEVESRR